MDQTTSPAGANSGALGSPTSEIAHSNIAPSHAHQDQFDNIPHELQSLRQWVVWRFERPSADGKLSKIPYTPNSKQNASTAHPHTWSGFATCADDFRRRANMPPGERWDGIGFVFTEGDEYAGVDFDPTDDPQQIAHHTYWVDRLNSYSERSPSGKGLHVIVKGRVPKGTNSRAHMIEVYSSGRFFTMTGNVYRNAWIADCQPELDALYAELNAGRTANDDTPDEQQTVHDDVVLERMFDMSAGDKNRSLWNGDWLTLTDSAGKPYESQSEADFALMEALRFQSASRSQCARMFRQSGMYRADKDADVERMAGKLGARPAIPEGVAASVQRLASEMASGVPAHAQVGSWPQSPSHIAGSQPLSASAVFATLPPPEPLSRDLPPAPAFPLDALGPILSAAARAITDIVQCPDAIAAQSVLGAASLAVQAHANVVVPATGDARPVSLFLLTIAESGQRKTAADTKAFAVINDHVKGRYAQYEEAKGVYDRRRQAWEIERKQADKLKGNREDIERALEQIGPPPEPPLKPILTCSEPTFEGLFKLFELGSPSLGMYSDEGGRFLSSHSMQPENRDAMAGGLNKLWDGSAIDRIRANETVMLWGRRMSMHLMMQPDISAKMLSDSDLKNIGFLGRILISAPNSNAGERMQRPHNFSSGAALAAYGTRIANILTTALPLAAGERNELAPRKLHLAPDAADLWRAYADQVEKMTGRNGEYTTVKELANKLPEHALRLAAVIALVEYGPDLQSIPAHVFTCGMQLADFYATEALRLWDTANTKPEIKQAAYLLTWLHERMREGHDTIDLHTVYQFGPRAAQVRDKASALRAARLLEDHRWLTPLPDRKNAWRVRPPQ